MILGHIEFKEELRMRTILILRIKKVPSHEFTLLSISWQCLAKMKYLLGFSILSYLLYLYLSSFDQVWFHTNLIIHSSAKVVSNSFNGPSRTIVCRLLYL